MGRDRVLRAGRHGIVLRRRVLAAAGADSLLLVTLMIPPAGILTGSWARGGALASSARLGFALPGARPLVLDGRIGSAAAKSVSR